MFLVFSIISLWELMTPGAFSQFGPQGLDWQDLCRGPLSIATYISCGLHGFSEEDFLSFSHYKSMGATYQHGGHLDLRTLTIFTNFLSPFNTRLRIKFEEIWLRGFREAVQRCECMDGQTDDGQRVITKAHPEPSAQMS